MERFYVCVCVCVRACVIKSQCVEMDDKGQNLKQFQKSPIQDLENAHKGILEICFGFTLH